MLFHYPANVSNNPNDAARLAELRRLEAERRRKAAEIRAINNQMRALQAQKRTA